jgi:hypothetical protein
VDRTVRHVQPQVVGEVLPQLSCSCCSWLMRTGCGKIAQELGGAADTSADHLGCCCAEVRCRGCTYGRPSTIHTSSCWCCVFRQQVSSCSVLQLGAGQVSCWKSCVCTPVCHAVSIVYICAICGCDSLGGWEAGCWCIREVVTTGSSGSALSSIVRFVSVFLFGRKGQVLFSIGPAVPAVGASASLLACSVGAKAAGIAEQHVSHDMVSSDAVQPVPLVIVSS